MTVPYLPIAGGVLIGLSATLLLMSLGRIAGISGIVWGAIQTSAQDRSWRWMFIVGLLLGAWAFHWWTGNPYPAVPQQYGLAMAGGLLVGLGVKIGNGCTSGHGVCGIGRFSMRSVVATVTFMAMAIMTVALMRLVFGGVG